MIAAALGIQLDRSPEGFHRGFELTGLPLRDSKQPKRVEIARLQADGGLELCDAFRDTSLLEERSSQQPV